MNHNRRKFLTGAGAGVVAALLPSRAMAAPLNAFAASLAQRIDGKCVGAQFTIADRYGALATHASGWCRLPHTLPARLMSVSEKLATASVSKTITAAALVRALYDNPSVSLDSPFAPYLPSHWTVHESLKYITFKQLLQHTSGIQKTWEVSYDSLKKVARYGVLWSDVGKYKYTNTNYALMRLLIPRIASNNILQIPPGTPDYVLDLLEQTQAVEFANGYISYTQEKVWDKTGVAPNMQCKPVSSYPALAYAEPPSSTLGEDYGDLTMVSASQGWQATSRQLAVFMRTLHETSYIMPAFLSKKMADEKLGYDTSGVTTQGFSWFHKSGDYPGPPYNNAYDGELHSKVYGFSNGIYLGLIINSHFGSSTGLAQTVIDAFDDVVW